MGSGFSTNLSSNNDEWGTVALFTDETILEKRGKECWGKINFESFENLNDDDMKNIVPIIVSKNSGSPQQGGWDVNHDVIRIIKITWVPEKKAYESIASIRGECGTEVYEKDYSTDRMYRLAINLEAFEDYKKMKDGTSDGSIFKRISDELEPFHVPFKTHNSNIIQT